MRRELLVPKLGLTMTEGTVVEWMVRPGEPFRAGQNLFVIESEKSATDIPAEADGVLLEITAETGEPLAVGSVIGHWDDLGQATTDGSVPPRATDGSVESGRAAGGSSAIDVSSSPAPATVRPASPSDGARVTATPLARRLARERGIDLKEVSGSGPRGRIRARDLPAAPATGLAPAPSPKLAPTPFSNEPAAPAPAVASGVAGALRAPTSIEQTIARRLVAAKQEIPHFYLAIEVEVTALQKLRGELNAAQSDQRFTLNHFILAAVGRALEHMPEVNRVWTQEGILDLQDADVGMAVHTERGLMVPVLRDIGRQPLAQIARGATAAAERAHAGRLGAPEIAGGAITVSNAGMHDVTYMTSIINPGQAMILGVGSVRGVFRPGDDNQPVLRREMGMVLSADHRVLDGVSALTFLKRIVSALESPLGLLVA